MKSLLTILSLVIFVLLSFSSFFASAQTTTSTTTTTTTTPAPESDGDDTDDPWQKTTTYRIVLIVTASICGGAILFVIILVLAKLQIEGSTGGYKSRQHYMRGTNSSLSGGSSGDTPQGKGATADYSAYEDDNDKNVNKEKEVSAVRQSASA